MKEIYTRIEDAGEIIRSRWTDRDLHDAVREKLQGDIPDFLDDGPSSVLWRHICTPDGEFVRFLEQSQKAGLKPLCLEYVEDKFAARNFTKYALVNLAFSKGLDKNEQTIVAREKIISFKDAETKRLCDLETKWGEGLVGFHHLFLEKMFPIMSGRVADISEWVKRQGTSPKEYYCSIFALAICHVVLFDDYDLLDSEMGFVSEIVLPSFHEIHERFGVKPLVVKISKVGEQERDPFWWAYSQEARHIMDEHVISYLNKRHGATGAMGEE